MRRPKIFFGLWDLGPADGVAEALDEDIYKYTYRDIYIYQEVERLVSAPAENLLWPLRSWDLGPADGVAEALDQDAHDDSETDDREYRDDDAHEKDHVDPAVAERVEMVAESGVCAQDLRSTHTYSTQTDTDPHTERHRHGQRQTDKYTHATHTLDPAVAERVEVVAESGLYKTSRVNTLTLHRQTQTHTHTDMDRDRQTHTHTRPTHSIPLSPSEWKW